jgi:type VI secretion system protein ImpH
MASSGRRSPRHLIREIQERGPEFRFFQAVRLLALNSRKEESTAAIPDSVRFSSPLSLGFPASEIASVGARQPRKLPAESTGTEVPGVPDDLDLDLTVGFMGMTGPSGALPVSYTELLIERRHQYRDTTAHKFLDIFTHRAVSLFYQAWRKHRFYLAYEAGNTGGFSRNLLDILGVGLQHLQSRLSNAGGSIPDRFLIHYAGLLSQKPMTASNMAALVRGFFGVDARLESYVGQWISLPSTEQSALDGRPCALGRTTFLGERLWDRQTKICLKLGPLSRQQFEQFMPDQTGLAALRELVRFCVGLTLECDVRLVLRRQDIPAPKLAAGQAPPRLGYNLWLNSSLPTRDADQTCFALLGDNDSPG